MGAEHLNNYIEQQINTKKENKLMNQSAIALIEANNQQIKFLKLQNEIFRRGIELRERQDVLTDNVVKSYKESIRNGEYGEEFKNMKFIDES